jgi:DNA-binding transcriptional regulator YiaG
MEGGMSVPTQTLASSPLTMAHVNLADKLFILRRRLGITVAQAAKRWRLNARALTSWEQETRKPSAANADRLNRIIARELARELKGFSCHST